MGEQILSRQKLDRLPLGGTNFSELRENNAIYVDKTALIYELTRFRRSPVFLSRPRRFGKSLLVSTFESLFKRGAADFKGLAIENLWQEDVSSYKVIHLDLSVYANLGAAQLKDALARKLCLDLDNIVTLPSQDNPLYRDPCFILEVTAKQLQAKSLVLLIDEYDSPITHHLNKDAEREEIQSILSSFFATIKSCEGMFRFVFITGITRITHVSLFSLFNNLKDITFNPDYAHLLGITEQELHQYFDPYVKNAAAVLDLSADEVYARLKSNYDGYQFSSEVEKTVYTPWSVLSFLSDPKAGFKNYWYGTSGGTPTLLINYLKNDVHSAEFTALKKEGVNLQIDRLEGKSEAENIPLNLLLLQTGYYTLRTKGDEYVHLEFPNEEIESSILRLTEDLQDKRISVETDHKLTRLEQLIDSADIEAIKTIFNEILGECLGPDTIVFNSENDVRDIIYFHRPQRPVLKRREHYSLKGRSDLELETYKTLLIIEFKRSTEDKSEEQALAEGLSQIKEKNYGASSRRVQGKQNRLRVCMVISSKKKKLSLWERLD